MDKASDYYKGLDVKTYRCSDSNLAEDPNFFQNYYGVFNLTKQFQNPIVATRSDYNLINQK